MQAVTGAKARLTVMTILPSREALFEQFLSRARSGDMRSGGTGARRCGA